MTHPLDGSRFKVARAQAHLDTLKNRIGAYLNSEPYRSVVQIDGDLVSLTQPVITTLPSPEFGAIVGECVYSLMAALDYIIWELCGRFVGRPLIPPPDGKDKPSFPLYKQPCRALTDVLQRLVTKYGVPTAARDLIAGVQPHNAGYEPLFLLYHLVNQDKHRVPLLALAQLRGDEWGFDVDVVRRGSDEVPTVLSSRGVMGGGSVSGLALSAHYGKPLPPESTVQVHVRAEVLVHLTLPHFPMPHEAVERTLEHLVTTVANVIPRFEPFF